MEQALDHFFSATPLGPARLVIAFSLAVLGKAADWLVDEAVALSERSGIPKVVIGATVVSLGTTMPEAAVSVFAAIQGNPGLAFGNAVGSIICDTGLILGLACVIAPLRLNRRIVNRQGWIQFAAGAFSSWLPSPSQTPPPSSTRRECCRTRRALLSWPPWPFTYGRAFVGRAMIRREPVEQHERDAGASSILVIAKLIGAVL